MIQKTVEHEIYRKKGSGDRNTSLNFQRYPRTFLASRRAIVEWYSTQHVERLTRERFEVSIGVTIACISIVTINKRAWRGKQGS